MSRAARRSVKQMDEAQVCRAGAEILSISLVDVAEPEHVLKKKNNSRSRSEGEEA